MTELIWDGKYKDGKKSTPVRIALPFQTIETVNETAQERQRSLDLFSSGREGDWRNRLIWGDKKFVLPSLLPEFLGAVNLIYIDPPFDTGADFSFLANVPDLPDSADDESMQFTRPPSIIEQKAYRDTWGRGINSWLQWFYETAILLRELLHETGTIYVHLDYHVSFYAKVILDEVFGENSFINEIVWKRQTAKSDVTQGARHMGRIHEVILLYSKSENYTWNMQYTPYDQSYIESFYRHSDADGRKYQLSDITAPGRGKASKGNPYYEFLGVTRYWRFSRETMQHLFDEGRIIQTSPGTVPRQKRYLDEMPGVPLQDLWLDIKPVQSQAAEGLGYDTQKPEELLRRVISLSSNAGDIVLDCFVGSGTTSAVAEKLSRRWIAADLGRFAVHTTRKRLLSIPNVQSFLVQNLGKYERQLWQSAEFESQENLVEREARYRKFILDLYLADPVTGYLWIHGSKNGKMIHVGAVDAPVTLSDVKAVAAEVWRAIGRGKNSPTSAAADILGWEFAFELNELAKQVAAEARVDVSFKKIPREVLEKKAVEQGDIRFFELAALAVNQRQKGRTVNIKLIDFVIPSDDIPDDVRTAIKHWSQLIDYWAVDWDYKDDTFHNQWQSYRTRKNPKLELETSHTYEATGKFIILVKVIDILGNDTTKTVQIETK